MENVLESSTPDQDQIQLVSVLCVWVSLGNLVLRLGAEEGARNAQVMKGAQLQ